MIESNEEYLRDLAERLMYIPAMYGTDGGDIDRLSEIAGQLRANPAGKVAGYTAQPDAKVALVNEFKADEERLLRKLDHIELFRYHGGKDLAPGEWAAYVGEPDFVPTYDLELLAEARKTLMIGFMLLNRAVFQPQRIRLPEDGE